MTDHPTEEHLRAKQVEEETKEHAAVRPEEAHAAARRADKAGYLADKLAEQREVDSRE